MTTTNKKKYNSGYWFFLEPYVLVSIKGPDVLLYNPLNGEIVEYHQHLGAQTLLHRLLLNKNLLVIYLKESELKDPAKAEFITKIRQTLMGDLLKAEWYRGKPSQIPPSLKILKDNTLIPDALEIKIDSMGTATMANLTEITFYINNAVGFSFLPGMFKQFPGPVNTAAEHQKLTLARIQKTIAETASSPLVWINILGGDILQYEELPELIDFLNGVPAHKMYYLDYRTLQKEPDRLLLLGKTNPGSSFLKIVVPPSLVEAEFASAYTLLKNAGLLARTTFGFVVQGEPDLLLAEAAIKKWGLVQPTFLPYYNGHNLPFFQEAVFSTREDILAATPSQKEVVGRQKINQIKFGKLTVLSDGRVYADVNMPALGRLDKNSLYEIVNRELKQGRSWKRTRTSLPPCRSCTYQYLCPSPSSYESVIGKNNLCWKA